MSPHPPVVPFMSLHPPVVGCMRLYPPVVAFMRLHPPIVALHESAHTPVVALHESTPPCRGMHASARLQHSSTRFTTLTHLCTCLSLFLPGWNLHHPPFFSHCTLPPTTRRYYSTKTLTNPPPYIYYFIKILKNVSCEYDRWVVETQLCKLRGTSDTFVGRACAMFHDMCVMVFVIYIYDMVVDTQFHKFHGRPFARILYVFLMKDIGRWLTWVPPGSTGRFYKDDAVHNHSVHRYYMTRIEGGVIYAWYCYMLNRTKKIEQKMSSI